MTMQCKNKLQPCILSIKFTLTLAVNSPLGHHLLTESSMPTVYG